MNPTNEHVRRFLARYGGGFVGGALKSVFGFYAAPALVLSDEGSVPVAACEEVEAAFDGATERYRAGACGPPSSPLRFSATSWSQWTCVGATSTSRGAVRSKTTTATWKVVHRHADPVTTEQPAESMIQE